MSLIVIFPSNLPSMMPYHLKLWMLKLLAFRWRKENYKLKNSILTLFSFPSPWVIPTCGRGTSLWRRWWRWGWFFLQKMITLRPWVSSQPVLQIKSPLLYYKTEIMYNGKGVRSSSLAMTDSYWEWMTHAECSVVCRLLIEHRLISWLINFVRTNRCRLRCQSLDFTREDIR